jgi:hypothetical protein
MSKVLKIEIFSLALSFHIILKNEECSVKSHEENHEENHEESHEENHEKIMKNVQSSYLQLSNIFSSRVEFLNQVVEFSFTTQLKFSISTFQLNST